MNREKNSASILFSNSSSVIFIIPLFGVSFLESWKSKLREKFGKCGSILKRKSLSAVHASAGQCSRVQFWREIVFFFSVSVQQITFSFTKCNNFTFRFISVVIFISKVCKKGRVLETVHDIVGYQVSDLIS